MPPNAKLRTWGNLLITCANDAGTHRDVCRTMSGESEKAGFINMQEKRYKYLLMSGRNTRFMKMPARRR